jgi:hypothetical protein
MLAGDGPAGVTGSERGETGDGEGPRGPWARSDSFRLGGEEN